MNLTNFENWKLDFYCAPFQLLFSILKKSNLIKYYFSFQTQIEGTTEDHLQSNNRIPNSQRHDGQGRKYDQKHLYGLSFRFDAAKRKFPATSVIMLFNSFEFFPFPLSFSVCLIQNSKTILIS